jgi:hypothetical protein
MNSNFVARNLYMGGDSIKVYVGFEGSGVICNSNLNLA